MVDYNYRAQVVAARLGHADPAITLRVYGL